MRAPPFVEEEARVIDEPPPAGPSRREMKQMLQLAYEVGLRDGRDEKGPTVLWIGLGIFIGVVVTAKFMKEG